MFFKNVFAASLCIGSALFTLTTAVQAKSPFARGHMGISWKLLEGMKKKAVAHPKKAIIAKECANYNGSWRGTCTDSDGSTSDDQMIISQDQGECDRISIDESEFPLGGAATSNTVGSTSSEYLTYFPQWNAGRNGINFHVNYVSRQNNADFYTSSRSTGTMEILDGHLLTRFNSTAEIDIFGQVTTETYADECTYDKVN